MSSRTTDDVKLGNRRPAGLSPALRRALSRGPVIAAAEKELLCWLREHHPQTVSGHSIESMRELRKGLNGSLDDEKDKNKTTETKPNRTIS